MKEEFGMGVVSRRSFLKAAAVAIGGCGLGPLLAACSAAPTANPAPVAPTSVPVAPTASSAPAGAVAPVPTVGVAKPKRGGTLRIAVDTLGADAFLINKAVNITRYPSSIFYEDGLYYDENQIYNLVPGLFESYGSSDMKQWTFKLRKGVQWDKGYGEVTADDIAFTLQLMSREDSKASDTPYWRPRIKGMKVVDPYTLNFSFDRIESDLAYQLSPWRSTTTMCKKYVEAVGEDKANQQPVGSGPFRMVGYQPGSQMQVDAVGDSHWRVAPKWDRIEFQGVAEESTRVAMLTSDRVDLTMIAIDSLKQVQDRFLIIQTPNPTACNFYFGGLTHLDKCTDPWKDIRVRQAMSLAVDRQAINKTFYGGLGTFEPSAGADIAPIYVTAQTFMPEIPYDPAKAKQLLNDAGKTGFDFRLLSYEDPNMPSAPQVTEAVAGYWEAIGLKPKIAPMDRLAFRDLWGKDQTDGMIWPWGMGTQPSFQARLEKFFSPNSLSAAVYNDPQTGAAIKQLATIGDADKRAKLLADTQLYLLNQWPVVHITNAPHTIYAAKRDKVASWKRSNNTQAITWEYIEPQL